MIMTDGLSIIYSVLNQANETACCVTSEEYQLDYAMKQVRGAKELLEYFPLNADSASQIAGLMVRCDQTFHRLDEYRNYLIKLG